MSDYFKDGFYIRNLCNTRKGVMSVRMEAYDANKVRIKQDAPVIPFPQSRWVSTKHIGTTDFIYVLVFFDTEEFNPPPGIGIKQGTHGGGGSIGISIIGTGGSVGASVTVTEAYSQPAAAIQMQLVKHKYPNGHESDFASIQLLAKLVDKGEDDDIYQFSVKELDYIGVQGPLLGS